MAFKLPAFKLPTFNRPKRDTPPTTGSGTTPLGGRHGQGNLPLIGHLDVQTQFRILGSIF
jgi:hypothetical protein